MPLQPPFVYAESDFTNTPPRCRITDSPSIAPFAISPAIMSEEKETTTASDETQTPAEPAAKKSSSRQSSIVMIGSAVVAFLAVIVVALLIQQGSGKNSRNSSNAPADLLAMLNDADENIDNVRGRLAGIENARYAAQAQLDSALLQIDNLQKTQAALGEQAGQAARYRSELDAAKATITSLEGRLENSKMLMESARAELTSMESARSELESLRTIEAEQKRTIESLTRRLDGAVPGSEAERLRADLATARTENESLRLELQKLRAELDRSRLYVEDAANLSPIAAALFTELESLEGSTPASLREAYARIERDINARRVDLIAFQTGSSAVDTGRVSRITRDIAASNEKSFFLVVGYASESGNSDDNRALSARRATSVASIVDSLKRPGNKVQAVYLGETDRFSPDSLPRNQVCEIWEIKPQTLSE